MQKASVRSPNGGTTTLRLLQREKSQAIVLGAALAAIAGRARNNERRSARLGRHRVVALRPFDGERIPEREKHRPEEDADESERDDAPEHAQEHEDER